ncbi:glycosyltransferase family 2 protein [Methylovorus glucosotrophus]|uniref:Glycosyl transferase family 2 n=1 Tax=Methylovorus glucosotrophus (strain SIP3-4) TaxID=582744 RepID=C6X8A4_METGS|nr:glycosyltransferase family 2 protein [Methylovorus glucosotrophus]ACT49374.1 glycosyl transferase family 2 [Methylovorus glucosotrophus SIP3-4]
MAANPLISISIVSHLQAVLVQKLLADIAEKVDTRSIEVILTCNLPEEIGFPLEDLPFTVKKINNPMPKGFGANHNAAFQHAQGLWFCIMNPDIRIETDPFPNMLSCMDDARGGLVGPRVLALDGTPEDSARRFPTPFTLFTKLLGLNDGRYAVPPDISSLPVDWVAGMFMLIRAQDFERLRGFDDHFFLYYEDVDLCVRLWKSGLHVRLCPEATVFHDARRASHKNLRYMRWHICSMLHYFRKHLGRLPLTDGKP